MTCPHCTTPLMPAPMRPMDHFEHWWKCAGWVDNKNKLHDGCGRAYWHDGPSVFSRKDPQQKVGFRDNLVEVTSEQRTWAERL